MNNLNQSFNVVKTFVDNLSFEEVVKKATNVPYNFKVSEFGNLYMLSFTDSSNLNLEVSRCMNGVVYEKETNKVVHYSFQKTFEGVYGEYRDNHKDSYRGEKPESCEVELSTEGTHVKLYYYNDKWMVGTSRSIDASISHWNNSKSFKELFFECADYEKFDINSLDKTHCYSFVMQHPENKICNNVSVKYCSMLNDVNLETGEIVRTTEGFKVDKSFDQVVAVIDEENCNTNYIIYLQDGRRIKLLNKSFKEKQSLLRNDPNMKRVYTRCIQENTVELVRKHFPNENQMFDFIDYRFVDVVKEIHRCYMNRYIHKSDEEVNEKYEKSLKQLHWMYRQNREKITPSRVVELLVTLPVKVLMFVLEI
jgi:hypothetical protein